MIKLRKYQQAAVDEYFKHIKNGKKHVCIALYPGLGKTYVSAYIAERYIKNGGVVIFIAPRINLVMQTIKSFDHLGKIQIIQGSRKYDEEGFVYIASLATVVRRGFNIKPALIIHDEKHLGHDGKSHKKIIEKFPDADFLSLTATPFDADGAPLKGFDAIIKYGTIQYYIDNHYLVDCECYAPCSPDLSELKKRSGDYTDKELDPIMSNSNMIGDIVSKTKDKIIGKKCLFFAVTIDHAENTAREYSMVGFNAVAYHSKIGDKEREKILKDFSDSKIDILVSVTALIMGFDQPDVDALIIARPTRSISFFRQLLGRGMRISPGKTSCLVLDCSGVINSSNLPNREVIPRQKTDFKTLECKICETKSTPYTLSVKKINSIPNLVTIWKCANGHFFETYSEISAPACKKCSRIIDGSDFRETSTEYEVFSKCICGEEKIIRTIKKSNYKLKKIKDDNSKNINQSSILGELENANEEIIQLKEYIQNKIHHKLQYDSYVSLHDSMNLEIDEIKARLKNTIIDSALKHNEFSCLSSNLLKEAYQKTEDPVNVLLMHNSRAKKRMQTGWATKTKNKLRAFIRNNPNYSNDLLLMQVKSKCQDINNKNQKFSSFFYYIDELAY